MSLKEIVTQSLTEGCLNPTQKAELERICHPDTILSIEEHIYLDRLMGAILTGEIAAAEE
jgi:hypothetical protein